MIADLLLKAWKLTTKDTKTLLVFKAQRTQSFATVIYEPTYAIKALCPLCEPLRALWLKSYDFTTKNAKLCNRHM